MYKDEPGIASKFSNEGGSVGKLVISSNRLDWVPRVAMSGFSPAQFGPWVRLSRRPGGCASALGLSAQIPRARRCR